MVEAAAHRDHLVVSEHENFINRGYTVCTGSGNDDNTSP